MRQAFEVIDLGAVNQELRIEIDAGVGCIGSATEPDTDFYVKPPLTATEHVALLEQVGPESKVGELLVASTEKRGKWLRFTADGVPSQEHVDLGTALAKEIIILKDLKRGKVVSAIGGTLHTHLVRSKSETELVGEEATVCDANEFEAGVEEDRNDPEWQAFLRHARKVVKRQAEIRYQREHADVVHVVEATEGTAVLRSPKTGRLYGISMDQGPEGEVVNVTELAELDNGSPR